MNFFDIIKAIYLKNKKQPDDLNNGLIMVIKKWMSADKDTILPIRSILPYLFYIEPIHFYYLLYFNIPKKHRVPFLKKIDSKKKDENALVKHFQYIFGWSNRELAWNRSTLDYTVLKDKAYWKKEFGL